MLGMNGENIFIFTSTKMVYSISYIFQQARERQTTINLSCMSNQPEQGAGRCQPFDLCLHICSDLIENTFIKKYILGEGGWSHRKNKKKKNVKIMQQRMKRKIS